MNILKLLIFFLLSIFSYTVYATADEAKFLEKVAEQYILAQFPEDTPERKIYVKASRVDQNRNYGGKCEGFLTAQMQGQRIKVNSTVKIICKKPQNSYTLYVPVTVKVLRRSIVATHNIPKGTTISSDLIEENFIDENLIMNKTITDKDMILGSKAKRDIPSGSPIYQDNYCLVCKGDQVLIEASYNNLKVKTSGIALSEGNLNDTIEVKNAKSGKKISGIVSGPKTVSVIM